MALVRHHVNAVISLLNIPAAPLLARHPRKFPQLPSRSPIPSSGMLIALIFIGVPFMVRTLQPALEDLDPEIEEAAASLGATPRQAFWRVVLPALFPADPHGLLAVLRPGHRRVRLGDLHLQQQPGKSQITAHLIMKKLEIGDEAGATLLGILMLVVSMVLLLGINVLQWWSRRRSLAGGV